MLRMDHVDDERVVDTFKEEVSSFKNTRHENIVLLLGYCLDPLAKLGIVMNYCRGQPLHELVHNGREWRGDTARVFNIAKQICQGMSYLHGRHILHKDLRTKNIFVEPNNKVVITDFGLFSMARLYNIQTDKQ
jgi:kinase suppressor of Ras 2